MAFIFAILAVSVYSEVNSLETATMVPKNSANLTSADSDANIFGSIDLQLRAAAYKNSLPEDQQSCNQISLVDSESQLVDCFNSVVVVNEVSKELADTLLLCSVHLTCKVSNKVTGRPNIKFSLPKSFQTIQWTVEPDESWNYQRTQVTHTLRATKGILSGTRATPSVVEIQLLRGKYDDLRVETAVENRTDYGLQLAWAGSKLVEPEDGGGGEEDVHYVSFRFDVNPLVLKITAKNIKDQLSLAISVLALFTSVIAFVKVMKIFSQCLIDKILLRRGASAPDDVLKRKQVLEEINNVEENNSASSPSQQEEKTSLDKNAGTPKKQRRLSSRELMAQNMLSNPMERLERGGGQPPKEIEMNDTGLTKSKGVSSEIVEKMLNDMREEMREEIREEMRKEIREEVDLLKSQMSQQQSQMADMAQVITRMDQERTSASSKSRKQRRATTSHSRSQTVIPTNWVRHMNEDGEE